MARILVIISTALLIFGSTIRMTEEYQSLGISIVYAMLVAIVLLSIGFNKVKLKYSSLLLITVYAFLLFGCVGALVNSDSRMLMRVFMYAMMFITCCVFIPSLLKQSTLKTLVIVIVVTHVPILFMPIILDGVPFTPYSGLFYNTNSLGGVAVTLMAVFASLLFFDIEKLLNKEKVKKKFTVSYILAVAFLLLIITYTTSRTSFLVALFILLAGAILLTINSIKKESIGKIVVWSIFIAPAAVVGYLTLNLFIPLTQSIDENIMSKFERKSGDALDGRSDIWYRTFTDAGLFGGGSDFFYGEVSQGAHNTFVSIMGMFGWIPMIMVALFFVVASIYSLRYFFKDKSQYKYLVPIMLVNFLSLSMAEDMSYKLSLVMALVSAGLAMNKKVFVLARGGYKERKVDDILNDKKTHAMHKSLNY